MRYDAIIVGAGPAGIFAAYELTHLRPAIKILIVEKGHDLRRRNCPILDNRVEKCPPPSSRREFGGWMQDYLPPSKVMELIEYVDRINHSVVVAPGRDGSEWFSHLLKRHGVAMSNNQVDIGVRVETSNVVMQELNDNLYEAKLIFNSSMGTRVRTFCANPSGHVVVENYSGVMTANGHSYNDPSLGSANTNFALLVSHAFTEPFDKPIEYAKEISRRANDLSGGSVIIQRYGDILRGRRSTEKRIREGFIEPTLKEAVPGDLGLVLPYNTMKSIIEMMDALDKVVPGIAAEHTLFYGVEAKFYSARPQLNDRFETQVSGLYAIGDGAGITRGLAQASAAGVHVGRHIAASVGTEAAR